MADIPVNVEVTQEDLDTLIARNPQISQILHSYALERAVREQASEIRRLDEQISGMEGEDDAESG